MDRDQHELQNYGFCGIYKESFNTILKWKKIFTQITLALIFPLTIITLVHTLVSQVIVYKTKLGPEYFEERPLDANEKRRLQIALWSFNVVYFVVALILSVLSTAAVVFTVACIYTEKQTTFKKVMNVMPKVWKRLTITFLWSFAVFFLFQLVAGVLLGVWAFVISNPTIKIITIVIFLVLYIVGFVYITMMWELASVVTVLEDVYGRKAVAKARKLMKGKMKVVVGCFVGIEVMFMIIRVLYVLFVVIGWTILALRILIGIVCGVLLVMVMLYGLVVPTVLYLVCKAYHHESIDKSSLSEHLEAYLGDYVTLRRDVQLQQVQDHV